jgi:uncharacterized membrane protein HdeD (DUF308 family)
MVDYVGPAQFTGVAMRSHSTLDASATLLGVALLVVTAVHITGHAATSIADEVAFGAALLFIGSSLAAHRAISKSDERYDGVADKLFFSALVVLLFAVLSFWF